MKRVHIYYSGRVQGVGFRFAAVDAAQNYPAISGYVRNTGDGRVEVLAEGPENLLAAFLQKLEDQMSRYVQDKEISWEPPSGQLKGFEIRY